MSERLRHRGTGAKTQHNGPVGLFCRFSGSVADAFFRNPRMVVVAHCRLDNRQELADRLEISPSGGDAALIGAAYDRWGRSAPEHLVGDFAFALWDASANRLFCARDLFGVRPFYYYRSDGELVFGSEIKALLACGEVPTDINEERVADYLAGVCAREDYTFYEHIHRLPSAHALVADREGVRLWRYASISPDPTPPVDSVEVFRERFDEAVRCRLRDRSDVAVTLSGGLDSSSIAATAACLNGRIHTFSALFEGLPECDESTYISDVVRRLRCVAHYVPGTLGPGRAMTGMERVLGEQDEPISAPNDYLPRRLFRAVKGTGLDVVLHGHGGDEVVSQGTGYLKELAVSRNWRRLGRELRGLSRIYSQPLVPLWLGYGGYGLLRQDRTLATIGGAMARRMYRRLRASSSECPIVSKDLARRTHLHERLRALPNPARADTERERHQLLIDRPERAYAFEVLDRIAHASSIEPRYPFWDARLVGMCLALPPEEKLRNGYGRLVLRRAMENRLPETVCWRRTKVDFLPNLIQGLTGHESKVVGCMQASPLNMEAYVDAAAVEVVCRNITAGDASLEDIASVIRVTLLQSWLEGRERRARDLREYHTPAAVCTS